MYLGRINYTRVGLRQLELLESDSFPTINLLLATLLSFKVTIVKNDDEVVVEKIIAEETIAEEVIEEPVNQM